MTQVYFRCSNPKEVLVDRNRAAIPRKELNMQVVSNNGGLFVGER